MKKILLPVGIILFVVAIAFNVNFSSKKNSTVDLLLANVEALALEENPNHCSTSCFYSWCGEIGIGGTWFQLYYCPYGW
jgi:hypothetical protein